MIPADRALATFYRLLVVTMFLSAAIWPEFLVKILKLNVVISQKR